MPNTGGLVPLLARLLHDGVTLFRAIRECLDKKAARRLLHYLNLNWLLGHTGRTLRGGLGS